ncbi:MAG: sulfurtransferase-like selenium metabolism protein YedF [Deltaproteobacteria bacterium]|jgi:selenium metabolism protein YedF|nr:sulfurtransferase-like selenium metabolism protein YedF [Deltaproteobacteria bacterium]
MKKLNMAGQPCPLPVIEAKKALKEASVGDTLTVIVDNEIAVQNLTKMARALGHSVKVNSSSDGRQEVTFTVSEKPAAAVRDSDHGGLVVAVSQKSMGHGDETLGVSLMKAFIFSLTELEPLPEYLLFFNGGAFLTTEGSASLKDLAALAERGVVIGTCGACLDFYNLKSKLKVGAVTNMYAIASTMGQARRLINI